MKSILRKYVRGQSIFRKSKKTKSECVKNGMPVIDKENINPSRIQSIGVPVITVALDSNGIPIFNTFIYFHSVLMSKVISSMINKKKRFIIMS